MTRKEPLRAGLQQQPPALHHLLGIIRIGREDRMGEHAKERVSHQGDLAIHNQTA